MSGSAGVLGLWALLSVARMVSAQDIAPAEILLFQTNHLRNLHQPATLTYAFKKLSRVEPSFDDEVRVDVSALNLDGSASVSMHFLSGERELAIPEMRYSLGNPALLGFLERDIGEMKRRTGGSTNYFRKRIRLALASAAQVRPVSFAYQGRQVEGREVSVLPYLDDPLRERFEKYERKRYVFVISEQVAGGIYQMRTSSPGSSNGALARADGLTEESLTLVDVRNSMR